MIVEVKDHHLVLVQKVELVQVGFVFQELIYSILMGKERGFVRDDHVLACGGGAFDDIQRRHHRRGNPFDGNVWRSGNDVVYGLCAPGNADIGFDAVNDLPGGQRGALRPNQACCRQSH